MTSKGERPFGEYGRLLYLHDAYEALGDAATNFESYLFQWTVGMGGVGDAAKETAKVYKVNTNHEQQLLINCSRDHRESGCRSVQDDRQHREPSDRGGERSKRPRPLTAAVASDRTRRNPRHQQGADDTDEHASAHEEQSQGTEAGHHSE
ncbi:hypothetical protein ABZY09_19295 [Streptomyces sp. NPDC002928]|uniref:hypothetical protein n=1 Tax=Streptomyces sp. NPDC002928 TaxID=3154440 RepID=UPI0033A1B20F